MGQYKTPSVNELGFHCFSLASSTYSRTSDADMHRYLNISLVVKARGGCSVPIFRSKFQHNLQLRATFHPFIVAAPVAPKCG